MKLSDLIEEFNSLEEWEDKYHLLIQLGDSLVPPVCNDNNKVKVCTSSVWIEQEDEHIKAYSDSAIVRGILFLVINYFDDIDELVASINLLTNLSYNRASGLKNIKEYIHRLKIEAK